MEIKGYKIKAPYLKIIINKIFFFVLGKAIVFLSKYDKDIRKNLKNLNVDTIKMNILGMDDFILLKKEKDRIKTIRKENKKSSKIEIFFKNIDSAFLLMTGQLGPEQGFWEHRIFLRGNISDALIFTEILKRVEAILFPGFFHKNLFKTKPKLKLKDYILRIGLYLLIPLWLIEFLIKGS